MELPPRLVLYDGVCGLCDKSVQWLLEHDPEGRLRYAALQGDTAAAVRAAHPELPPGTDSILFLEDGVLSWRSRAVVRLCAHLPRPWSLLSWLRVVPAPLTDLGYRLLAAVRYRIWGQLDACRIPEPGEAARFLP